ncbi:MAG: energy transducer TonB [Halioglobus sp.]
MENPNVGSRHRSLRRRLVARLFSPGLSAVLLMAASAAYSAGFNPPQNTNPGQTSTPTLDASYEREAWLVYTYDISTAGEVINVKIHSSNEVAEVENRILSHVNAMRYTPATRNGNPVQVSVGPIVYTWILDTPREMTPQFSETYQQAWAYFKQQNYDQAFDLAASLKNSPGRSAYEEIKFQVLAASLSSRWDDEATELSHLNRIVEFQSLADSNRFINPYVEEAQYLLMLERIHTLQLGMMMLADAEVTLGMMMARGADSEPYQRAYLAHQEAEGRFTANPDVMIAGELTPIYREGQGVWEARLFREKFSVSGVKGTIESLHLSCKGGGDMRLRYPSRDPWTVPAAWNDCTLEVAGRSGTRFTVHQLMTPGQATLQ